MDQVIVVNTRPNLRRIFWAETRTVNGKQIEGMHCLKLGPGANLVDSTEVERALQIPSVKALFERNILIKRSPPKETKGYTKGMYIENLAELKPDQALQAIKDCEDPKVLSQWAAQDGRKRIKDALIERHEAIMDEKEPGEEKDAE